ncbi:TOMM precursor leader peptide-binding protein [Lysobacter korlensis]|uniref:TOMM leader peptide-binding protein n=1 Tax=Lysobacter korlensis TaxID=553636 RepID=A0ABV6RZ20_9GAMM
MVVRLDPKVPVLWRTPTSLQIGLDPARVVMTDVSPLQERLLAAVVTGTTELALETLAGRSEFARDEVRRLLDTLDPVLERPSPAPRAHVAVCGPGPTADRIATLLGAEGIRVSLARDERTAATLDANAAVLVGYFVLAPWHLSFWLRRDVPHLPVVFSDTGVRVGPVLIPGDGPCLYCLELAHIDEDPAWPALATQLLGRRGHAETALLSTEAAVLAVRGVLAALTDKPDRQQDSVVLRLSGSSTRHAVARHHGCLCSDEALRGIGSAAAPRSGSAPTPSTTGARPSGRA